MPTQCPNLPAGVRLIHWEPKETPIQVTRFSTVVEDVDKFVCATLRQVEAQMLGKEWLAGNWGLPTLLERLAAVGCHVELENLL